MPDDSCQMTVGVAWRLSFPSRVLAEIVRACAARTAIKPAIIATRLGSSGDAVRPAISILKRHGYIRSERRGGEMRYEHVATGRKSAWIEWASRLPRAGAGRKCEAAVICAGGDGKLRPCICCGDSFWSAGIGNRMCKSCRRNAAADVDITAYRVPGQTARKLGVL